MMKSKALPPRRGTAQWLLCLGLVLAGVGAGGVVVVRSMRGGPPANLEVVGSAEFEADHPDRSRPFKHTFVLRNPSARPVRIREVKTNCTCTTIERPERTVGPGQTTEIVMIVKRFDPYEDRFSEGATIATDVGLLSVRLLGHLPPSGKVHVHPPTVYLSGGGGAQPGQYAVRLRVPKACAARIGEGDCAVVGYPGVTVRLDGPRADGPYEEYSVHLSVPPGAGGGEARGTLQVKTGCDTVTVPIVAIAIGS